MTKFEQRPSSQAGLLPGPPIAGHSIQRDESQHVFLIDENIVVCTPVQYRLLALLLSQADRCVPYRRLLAQLQDDLPMSLKTKTKLIHLISDIRSKLWPLGLDIVSVLNVGYILLSSETEQDGESGT